MRIAGEPKGISTGQALRVDGLRAQYREIEGRSGISFRADRLEPAGAAPKGA